MHIEIEPEVKLKKVTVNAVSAYKERAFNIFRATAKDIPAYADFLKTHHLSPSSIKTINDFEQIPSIDKTSYILKYPTNMLTQNGKTPALGHASSGSSGQPTFWFRGIKQDEAGTQIYGKIFNQIFKVEREQSTLVIICFSMGIWIAGLYTLMACREITRMGYNVSTLSPGIDIQDICAILKNVAPSYEKVILIGYPSFLTLLFDDVHKNSIPIHSNLYLITSGDKFSEEWRHNMSKQIGKSADLNEARIINIYGSADAGILGYETPLSIFIRQQALKNNELCQTIFGVDALSSLPTLVQYEPKFIYFEEVNGELLLTTDLDIPLVRYNIHDQGKVIRFQDMQHILSQHGIVNPFQNDKEWELPFVTIAGRTDVAVNFDAVKIYPECIGMLFL